MSRQSAAKKQAPTATKTRPKKPSARALALREETQQQIREKISGSMTLNSIQKNYEEIQDIQQRAKKIDGPITKRVGSGAVLTRLSPKDQVDKLKLELDCVKLKLDTNWRKLNKLLPDAKEVDEGEETKNKALSLADSMAAAMEAVEN